MPEIIAHYGGLRVLVPTASPPGITRAWSRHRNVPLTSQVHLFSARPYRPGQGPITSAVDTNRWRPGFFSQRLSPAAPSDLGMPRLTLPEKRKVGGSTPPLTTTLLPSLSWANTCDRPSWSVPVSDRQTPLLAPVNRT